jgi:hypothetical protein
MSKTGAVLAVTLSFATPIFGGMWRATNIRPKKQQNAKSSNPWVTALSLNRWSAIGRGSRLATGNHQNLGATQAEDEPVDARWQNCSRAWSRATKQKYLEVLALRRLLVQHAIAGRVSYRLTPWVPNNQNAEVSHNTIRIANSTPPAMGSAQPG